VTLLGLVWRNLQLRALSSTLTALGVALGTMLVTAILILQAALAQHYEAPGRGYGIVVGAPGSALQLVLSAIYHVDDAPGLMPMRVWWELEADDSVALAVPYAVGDAFRGYRVVATTDAFFDRRSPQPAGEGAAKLAEGRPFHFDRARLDATLAALGAELGEDPGHVGEDHEDGEDHRDGEEHQGDDDRFEAVVGAEVARALGVRVGDRIEPTHGVEGGRVHDEEHLWEVVGILKPTDTAVDRLVLIPLDSFFAIEDHRGGALLPGTREPGLSAVLVFPRPGVHKVMLLSRLNRRPEIQVADVHEEVRNLFAIVGSVDVLFLLVAILVVVVGVLSVLVALYNSMNERRREVAILRAIGAPRRWVLGSVVTEAMAITALGALAGVALGHLLVAVSASRVEATAGFRPAALTFVPAELAVIALVVVGGALAGLGPAWKAYRTDVAENLRPT